MRTRLIIAAAVGVAVVAIVIASVGGSSGDEPRAGGAGFVERTVQAGDIEVRLKPEQIDATGAALEVVLDTHDTELDMDLAAGAALEIGGRAWPTLAWEGDGPGGHHREGRLRFDAAGPADGEVTLRLDGFDEPVEATWTLGGAR